MKVIGQRKMFILDAKRLFWAYVRAKALIILFGAPFATYICMEAW
jgi:hypothetical protein